MIKTKSPLRTLKRAGYEIGSWICPGSVPHLLKYYTNSSENYATDKGTKKALKSLESKVINLEEYRKKKKPSEDLEELAKAS